MAEHKESALQTLLRERGQAILEQACQAQIKQLTAALEAVTPPPCQFALTQRVVKVTGDYRIQGVVRAIFRTSEGKVRLVVEHDAEGGGSFLHIYSEANLAAWPLPLP